MNPNEPRPEPDKEQKPISEQIGGTDFLVREVVLKKKSEHAWGALSAKIIHYLRTRFANNSLPPGVEFDDFVSEAMLKILTAIDTFEHRGKDSFWKWVQTLATNLSRDMWRKFDRDRKLGLLGRGDSDAGDENRPPSAAEAARETGETPTQVVRFRELQKAERECASKLGKDMREVYMMRRQLDLTFAEISTRMGGTKEATLRSHYMRARDQIRDCLGSKIDELGKRISGWQ
jgi:RNA polymerase sigma factor (sigma-70 family)